ncbi:hypothetical protein [Paenibacillus sp. DMB20]|uniref:hypothetical protein n=1 Tax=Paenibacillus sp. DMB20 TaxID=1642570 RepID=UPI00062759AF|nr:hypothetical protein [Paenibacillus sp. DMB20]KKO51228.1 hypothetical protein XI25_27365 [Paenibacillus sp. DMB20]
MTDNKTDYEGRFPGVEPIPEPDRPDHAATDMLDEVVTGILENKDEDEIKKGLQKQAENPVRSWYQPVRKCSCPNGTSRNLRRISSQVLF